MPKIAVRACHREEPRDVAISWAFANIEYRLCTSHPKYMFILQSLLPPFIILFF